MEKEKSVFEYFNVNEKIIDFGFEIENDLNPISILNPKSMIFSFTLQATQKNKKHLMELAQVCRSVILKL